MMRIVLLSIVYLLTLSEGSFFAKKNGFTDLREELLKGYHRNNRPVKDHNANTTIKFAIALNNIDLDDHAQRMTAVTYLFIAWNDEFLHWFPSDYGDIYAIHFDRNDVWMPDIALFNSAKSLNVAPTSTLPILCNYDGNLLWVPPFTAHVPCEIDIEMWPSDVHTCTLRFGSWAHHGEQIDLQVDDKAITVDMYEENKRWSLVNYTASREFTEYKDELYIHIDFKITVRREAAAHAAYVTQTVFGVMIMILGAYFLPLSYHLSRFLIHLFSITILVSCQFVLFISLPATGGSIPHVVKYFSGSVILTTLSLLCNILLVCSMTASKGIPINLRKTISSVLKSNNNSQMEFESRGEVEYNHLREEDSVGTPADCEETTLNQSTNNEGMKNARQLHRVLNGVLFAIFFAAYVIDYALMRQTIGY